MNDEPNRLGGQPGSLDAFDARRGLDHFRGDAHDGVSFEEDDGLDLRGYWRILRTYWYWILAAGALGTALALIFSLLAEPLYRSTASLELNPPTVPILNAEGQGDQLTVANTDWQFLATQYGLLRSRDLARRVVEDLNLAAEPEESASGRPVDERIERLAGELSANLTVSPIPESRLVELTYSSTDPFRAARIVNGFADAFLEAGLNRRYEATGQARKFLSNRLSTVREELNESEKALVRYARAHNIVMPGTEGENGEGASSLTGASLSALNAALADAQQRRIAAEQRYRQASSITETRQSTSALRQQRAALMAEYQEKSTYLKESFPEMVRLKAQIDALDQAIRNEAGSAAAALRAEYQAALAEERNLQARVQQLSGNMLNEQELSVQYNTLKREVDTNRSLYDALLERYNEIGVVQGIGTAQAAIVDRGEVPGGPYTPNVPRNVLLGLILGLGIGMAAAFAYEFLTDTIKTPEDVREKLRLPLLGTIPKKKLREDLAEVLSNPRSEISEAYGSLVTALQYTTNEGFPKVITVTSAGAAEGKSTTSLIIASRLAHLGKSVLLIDADMRKPSFVVEESTEQGLSMLLTGDRSFEAHFIKTSKPGLFLMPSGPTPPDPSLLLNSKLMRSALAEMRQRFDHIVLDGPPVLGFSDSSLLGSQSDGVLLIVESGKTRRKVAMEAIKQLRSTSAVILGATLSKYAGMARDYGYASYYYEPDSTLTGKVKTHELTERLLQGGNGR